MPDGLLSKKTGIIAFEIKHQKHPRMNYYAISNIWLTISKRLTY